MGGCDCVRGVYVGGCDCVRGVYVGGCAIFKGCVCLLRSQLIYYMPHKKFENSKEGIEFHHFNHIL